MQVALAGLGRIDGGLLAGGRVQQRRGPLQRDGRIGELRLDLLDRALLGLDIGLEGRPFEPVEHLTLLDLVTFPENILFDESRDPSHDVDAGHGLDPSDEPLGLGDRVFRRLDDADRRGPVGRCLSQGGRSHHGYESKNRTEPLHRRLMPYRAPTLSGAVERYVSTRVLGRCGQLVTLRLVGSTQRASVSSASTAGRYRPACSVRPVRSA